MRAKPGMLPWDWGETRTQKDTVGKKVVNGGRRSAEVTSWVGWDGYTGAVKTICTPMTHEVRGTVPIAGYQEGVTRTCEIVVDLGE